MSDWLPLATGAPPGNAAMVGALFLEAPPRGRKLPRLEASGDAAIDDAIAALPSVSEARWRDMFREMSELPVFLPNHRYMDETAAAATYARLIREKLLPLFGLQDYRVRVEPFREMEVDGVKKIVRAYHDSVDKVLVFSSNALLGMIPADASALVLHEVAHALRERVREVPGDEIAAYNASGGHDDVWRRICLRIGGDGSAKAPPLESVARLIASGQAFHCLAAKGPRCFGMVPAGRPEFDNRAGLVTAEGVCARHGARFAIAYVHFSTEDAEQEELPPETFRVIRNPFDAGDASRMEVARSPFLRLRLLHSLARLLARMPDSEAARSLRAEVLAVGKMDMSVEAYDELRDRVDALSP